MLLPSTLVGITGRPFEAILPGGAGRQIAVQPNPLITLTHVACPGGDARLSFAAKQTGRGLVTLSVDGEPFEIPAVVFRPREFFVSLVISSNYHVGFDPEAYHIWTRPDGTFPEGHGYRKVCRTLTEPHVHALGLPITWLIDSTVAFVAQDDLRDWHRRYYDDFGVMPPSYIHQNAVNYNQTKTVEQLTAYLAAEKARVEDQLGWTTDVVGIDQFIGSVDNGFAAACENLGVHGLWGMGFDHFACDTSMYHRGCPWDCYKPDASNVRIPADYPTDLWAFQWTQRDLIHTMKTPTGPSGSVVFSTDVDDIRTRGIMAAQPDYYDRLLADAYENYLSHPDNDFGVFLMHQEDHDTGFEDNNQYWGRFLRQITQPVTFATLHEIAAWLNLTYGRQDHPAQTVLAHDVLSCPDAVQWGGGVERPDDWGRYDPYVFYYDRNVQLAVPQGQRLPCRVFDYARRTRLAFGEIYPERELPRAQVTAEDLQDGVYTVCIRSQDACADLPLMVHYADADGDLHARVLRVDLAVGENTLRLPIDPRAVHLV